MGDNVDGEIRKKMLLTRGTRLNNILAPKIRNLFKNISQAGALVPLKTDKSEHSNLTNNLTSKKLVKSHLIQFCLSKE